MDLLTSTQGTRGIRRRWGGDDASVARVPSSCRWLFKNLHLGNYLHSPVVSKWRIGFGNRAMALGWLQNTHVKAENIPGSSTVVAQKRIANAPRLPSKPGDCHSINHSNKSSYDFVSGCFPFFPPKLSSIHFLSSLHTILWFVAHLWRQFDRSDFNSEVSLIHLANVQ